MSLLRRVEALESSVPPADCQTCAARPVFILGGPAGPCAECGRAPLAFTIDIDRASARDGDAA